MGRIIHFICNAGKEIDWNDTKVEKICNFLINFPYNSYFSKFSGFDENYSNDLIALMKRLLSSYSSKRPSAYEVLNYSKTDERISTPMNTPTCEIIGYNGICVKPNF